MIVRLSFMSVAVACSAPTVLAASYGDNVERALNTPVEVVFESEYVDWVNLCMSSNGFDTFRMKLESRVEVLGSEVPLPLDPDEARQAFAENGSGIVALLLEGDENTGDGLTILVESENEFAELTPEEEGALYFRQGASPRDDVSNDRGCAEFGREALLLDYPGYLDQQELSHAYGEHMLDEFFGSPEFTALQDEWSDCMASEGFHDLPVQGSQYEFVEAEALRFQSDGFDPSSPEFLEFVDLDRRLAVAGFDCDDRIAERRLSLKNRKAEEFVEATGGPMQLLLRDAPD